MPQLKEIELRVNREISEKRQELLAKACLSGLTTTLPLRRMLRRSRCATSKVDWRRSTTSMRDACRRHRLFQQQRAPVATEVIRASLSVGTPHLHVPLFPPISFYDHRNDTGLVMRPVRRSVSVLCAYLRTARPARWCGYEPGCARALLIWLALELDDSFPSASSLWPSATL